MDNRTAQDVANMEAALFDVRLELEDTKRLLTIANTEKNELRVQVALLQRKADENLEKAVQMETIMTQVSSGLVAGLNKMKEERAMKVAVRRQVQEHVLEVGSTAAPAPAFLQREEPQAHPRDLDQARAEQLRGAAEHVAQPPPPRAPAGHKPFDPDLADRDDRIPRINYEPRRAPAVPVERLDAQVVTRR